MTPGEFKAICDLLREIADGQREIVAALKASAGARPAAGINPDKLRGWQCPKCGSPMQVRRSKKPGGKEFAGCTKYPACAGIRWHNGRVPDGAEDYFPPGGTAAAPAPTASQPNQEAPDDVPF